MCSSKDSNRPLHVTKANSTASEAEQTFGPQGCDLYPAEVCVTEYTGVRSFARKRPERSGQVARFLRACRLVKRQGSLRTAAMPSGMNSENCEGY